MSRKTETRRSEKTSAIRHATRSRVPAVRDLPPPASPAHLLRQALNAPERLTPSDVLTLQRATGNRAVQQIFGAMRDQTGGTSLVRGVIQSEPAVGLSGEAPEQTVNEVAPQRLHPPRTSPESSPSPQVLQRRVEEEELPHGSSTSPPRKENATGLPDVLKAGVESLSGISVDDVKVHYNSSLPARLGALAYTQGTDIHLKPEEEEHLPHEAWHVVQQKQGRVKPTLQAKGFPINDDRQLESEADVMGERARQLGGRGLQMRKTDNLVEKGEARPPSLPAYPTVQLLSDDEVRAYLPVEPFEDGFKARHVASKETDFTGAKAEARRAARNIDANTIVKMTKADGFGELKIAIRNLTNIDEKTVKNRTYLWNTRDDYQWKTAKRDGSLAEGTSKHQLGMILVEKPTRRDPTVTEMEGIKITHYEKTV